MLVKNPVRKTVRSIAGKSARAMIVSTSLVPVG
jgi:hypothetical protein